MYNIIRIYLIIVITIVFGNTVFSQALNCNIKTPVNTDDIIYVCKDASRTLDGNPSGGTPPYTHQWSGVGAATVLSDLNARMTVFQSSSLGTFTLTYTVTDAFGATKSDVIVVEIKELPTIDVSPSDTIVCDGESAQICASGGIGYYWSYKQKGESDFTLFIPAVTDQCPSFSPTDTTEYQVEGRGANGCLNYEIGIIKVLFDPDPDAGSDATICQGDDYTITDSEIRYYPSWHWETTGDGTFDDNTLKKPTYTPGATDEANGYVNLVFVGDVLSNPCSDSTDTMRITIMPPPIADAGADETICDFETFTITTASVQNTTSLTWTTSGDGSFNGTENVIGATYTPGITDMSNGTVTLTITASGAAQCTDDIETMTLSIDPSPVLSSVVTDVSCFGGSNGAVNISIISGNPSSYLWDSGQTTQDISGVIAGSYCVTVTDVNGCTKEECVVVNEPALMVATTSPTQPSCNSDCNGSIDLTITGGNGGNSFLWDFGGLISEDINNLCENTYCVTATDSKGCTATACEDIISPVVLSVTINKTDLLCNGVCVGTTTAVPSGGTPNYSYLWSDGLAQTDITATGLCAGDFTVTVTDNNGCTISENTTLTEPPLLVASISGSVNPLCNGDCNGSATATQIGGTAGYTYLWNNAQTTATAINLCDGSYTVTVTDANNCESTIDVTLIEAPVLTASILTSTNPLCNGDCNGSASATQVGGTAGYTYLWNDGQTTATATGLCDGSYTVTVTDANNCESTIDVTITEPPLLVASISGSVNLTIFNVCNGSATVTQLGGTAGYTYLWSDPLSQTTATANNLCADNYTVTVTDANNCESTIDVTITEPPLLVASIFGSVNPLCNGDCNGSATATQLGGTAGYTYLWNNGQTTATATGLCVGGYTVTVTDNNGAESTASIILTQPQILVASIFGSVNPLCNGDCNGSATATQLGGTAGYTYLWNDGQTTATATGLCDGSYTVTVTDINNCESDINVTITQPITLTLSTSQTNVSCNGENNGSATVTPVGGTPNYSYIWSTSPAQITALATGLTAGSYTVTVTDDNGCSKISSVNITQPTELIGVLAKQNLLCNSVCAGKMSVDTIGGTQPIVITWSNGLHNDTISSLCVGVYSVTLTDAKGCTKSYSDNISQPNLLNASIFIFDDPTCFGKNDGYARARGIGGTSPYTYGWSNLDADSNNINLTAGTYIVTVTDANLCTVTASVTLTDPAQLTASINTFTNVRCNGECNGSTAVTPAGGIPGYSYLWNDINGQQTQNATGLCAGNYIVTVTDANGCTVSASKTITQPNIITASLTQSSNILCNGDCNGAITATPSGGNAGGYTYLWSDNQTTQTAAGLCAGTYSLTISDVLACTYSDQRTINEPSLINITYNRVQPSPCGSSTGSITLNITGGTPAYTYSWANPGLSGANPTNIKAGNYTVTVTDSRNCTESVVISLSDANGPIVSLDSVKEPSCNGLSDGIIYVSTIGGSSPYTYLWDDQFNQTSSTVINLTSGNYGVTVTDFYGCTGISSFALGEPDVLDVSFASLVHVSCFNGNDGKIVTTINGGTGPYSFEWNPVVSINDSAVGLVSGNYSVTVTDANGCTDNNSTTINNPADLQISISGSTDPKCYNSCDGTIQTTTIGGTPGYNYQWSNIAQITSNVLGLCRGVYIVTVTDSKGCTETTVENLTPPSLLSIKIDSIENITCNGEIDGEIYTTTAGGAVPYNFSWNIPGETNSDLTGLFSGNYTVTVTDANNCTSTADTTIIEPQILNISINSKTDITCYDFDNGLINTQTSGGTQPYSYLWTNNVSISGTANNLPPGNYTITVSDKNNCQATTNTSISEPAELIATGIVVTQPQCSASDGILSVSVSGGITPYSYLWTPSGKTTQFATGLTAGGYTILITDKNGCTDTDVVALSNQNAPTASIVTSINVSCYGGNNGSAVATAVGGTPSYVFNWNPSGQIGATAINLTAGTYVVSAKDQHDCIGVAEVTITQPAQINIQSSVINNTTCNGYSDGQIFINISGGTGAPYTYLWSNGKTTRDIDNLTAGTYCVTVTDNTGCTNFNCFTVQQPNAINVTLSKTNVTCYGNCDGTVTAEPTGGTAPYVYTWNTVPPLNTKTISGLCPNNYKVTVSDSKGCPASNSPSISVIQPDTMSLTYQKKNLVCYGDNNGWITLSLTGGTPPYKYEWNNFATTSSITGLTSGIYTVDITDKNGCIKNYTPTIQIVGPTNRLNTLMSKKDISCNGNNNGEASVVITGGYSPYDIQWNTIPVKTTSSVTNLSSRTYIVSISDTAGCLKIDSVKINEPLLLAASTNATDITCHSYKDGKALISASGGTAPYTYLWTPSNQTTAQAIGLAEGTYSCQITDKNGCQLANPSIVFINEPDTIDANIVTLQNVLCYNDSTGIATVVVTGGTPDYSFVWSDHLPQTERTATGLPTGRYTAIVRDKNSCLFVPDSITIIQPASPLFVQSSSQANNLCYGENEGQATVNISGGTSPYYYEWNTSTSQTNKTATGLRQGVYTVLVKDANDCVLDEIPTFNISHPENINITFNTQIVRCFGDSTGSAIANVTGGTSPYTYQWQNPLNLTTNTVTGLKAGTYYLSVSDANNCLYPLQEAIIDTKNLQVNIDKTDVVCFGYCNGTASAIADNGNTPYTYIWNDTLNQTTINANDLCQGNYTVTVTDAYNCTKTANVIINEPNLLIATAGQDLKIGIGEPLPLTVTSNSSQNLIYKWSPSEGLNRDDIQSPTANITKQTTYIITTTNEDGCFAKDTITVSVISGINLTNTITPNGDAFNQKWIIENIEYFPQALVQIFNRWGKKVYESKGYYEGFDGTYNGELLPTGTYFYIIKLNDTLEPLSGYLNLFR